MHAYFKLTDIPNHYTFNEHRLVCTDDCFLPQFKYTRFIYDNGISQRGFPVYVNLNRINFYDAENGELINDEVMQLVVKDRLTAIHYSGDRYITDLITGISPDVIKKLPSWMHKFYYDLSD